MKTQVTPMKAQVYMLPKFTQVILNGGSYRPAVSLVASVQHQDIPLSLWRQKLMCIAATIAPRPSTTKPAPRTTSHLQPQH